MCRTAASWPPAPSLYRRSNGHPPWKIGETSLRGTLFRHSQRAGRGKSAVVYFFSANGKIPWASPNEMSACRDST